MRDERSEHGGQHVGHDPVGDDGAGQVDGHLSLHVKRMTSVDQGSKESVSTTYLSEHAAHLQKRTRSSDARLFLNSCLLTLRDTLNALPNAKRR